MGLCFFLEFFYNLCRKTQILHLEKNIFHKYWLFCSGFILFKFDLVTFCLLSVIHKQWLKEYIYYTGFSLSFKVDSYDVNIGGLETKCCRQLQDFTFSLYPLPQKVEGSNVQVGGFLAGCRHLTKTLTTSTNQPLTRFRTDYMSSVCHFCYLMQMCPWQQGWMALFTGHYEIVFKHPCWWHWQHLTLSPNINIHLLHTVLHTFLMVLLGRICCNITTFHLWWSFH